MRADRSPSRRPQVRSLRPGATMCAAVMGTAIVSVDLASAGWEAGSRVLAALAVGGWLALAVTGGLRRHLAGVPATAVLGTRLVTLGAPLAAGPVLAVAALLWALALPRVRLPRRSRGSHFLVVVATQSLAVLGAALAGATGAHWLAAPLCVLLCGGVAFYAGLASRFDPRQLRRGGGDQWIAGGALAISALAAADLAGVTRLDLLRDLAVILAGAAVAWFALLVLGELAAPRAGEAARRWSTVFPVGMYGAMSLAVGREAHLRWLVSVAHAWAWVSLAVWTLTAAYSAWWVSGPGSRDQRRGSPACIPAR